MTRRAFGELELSILNILKTRKRVTVREVHEALGGEDKYTTIMTVMNRLVEKNELTRQRVGLQYEYWIASQSRPKALGIMHRLKQSIFGGKSFAMISYLIESSDDLTKEELADMERLVAKAKKTKQ